MARTPTVTAPIITRRPSTVPKTGRKKCPSCRRMKPVTAFPTRRTADGMARDTRECRECRDDRLANRAA